MKVYRGFEKERPPELWFGDFGMISRMVDRTKSCGRMGMVPGLSCKNGARTRGTNTTFVVNSGDTRATRPVRFCSLVSCFLLLMILLSGCRNSRLNITSATLVGTYVFRSDAPKWTPRHRIGERLTLHGDGTYILESGERNDSIVSSGRWVFRGGHPAIVDLDHAGYPIELGSMGVRLIVNYDVDARYEKMK